jgi:hypothetical protein
VTEISPPKTHVTIQIMFTTHWSHREDRIMASCTEIRGLIDFCFIMIMVKEAQVKRPLGSPTTGCLEQPEIKEKMNKES